MNSITVNDGNTSPFDQLKKIDELGTEYWLATDLLASMGYRTWKRIKDTVERAIFSAHNSGVNISYHFTNVVQMAQIGDSQAFRETLKDYKLSRYACYITAMNGDPRKPEIAAAQSYFAFLTREAELASQNHELVASILEKLDLHNQIIEKQDQVIRLLQSQIQNLLPASKVNYIPPGWDASVWNKLPLQDKRHFRFLHRRRGFRPDYRTEVPLQELTEQFKQKQRDELKTAVVEVSSQEKQRLEALRLEALKLLREEGVEND
ncbi:DNA-damage-inducible protein [Rivularia sp. UHCC 0363]|uniref:DNA-damage-inducible protein n=1 Tax=Rivularia sp. UHCC 0363 TaxID=3110244 RepID=UPI002B2058D1|nr:DNA-damage-inducible protein [Rivularia sp. UHCC 0363]MEA5596869.1 DNA-damage-inducible protein [Rivularia sp. UHCC 0363]